MFCLSYILSRNLVMSVYNHCFIFYDSSKCLDELLAGDHSSRLHLICYSDSAGVI